MKLFEKTVLVLSLGFGLVSIANADFWISPSSHVYKSNDKKYSFTVTPPMPVAGGVNQSIYLGDLVDAEEESAIPWSPDCMGKLEFTDPADSKTKSIWESKLSNQVAPTSVIVSDSGYVATFDNWRAGGHGLNAVVIYGRAGEIVKEYSLTDFLSDERIQKLPRSISSIWWGGRHYFDGEYLVLRITRDNKLLSSENRGFDEVRLRLIDGKIISELK